MSNTTGDPTTRVLAGVVTESGRLTGSSHAEVETYRSAGGELDK